MDKQVQPRIKIPTQACESSQFSQYGYDAETKTLAIQFHGGAIYHYDDVPQEVFDGLCGAESKGSFFIHNIKRGQFKFEKQPKDEDEPKTDAGN